MVDVDKDIDEIYEERAPALKHRREHSEKRKQVKDAYQGKNTPAGGDPIKYATDMLAWSDRERKDGNLSKSYDDLTRAAGVLYKHEIWPDKESRDKIAQATVNRAARLFYKAKDDEKVTKESYELIRRLGTHFGVKPKKPSKSLETLTVVLSFAISLFFLSPNVTGNVIGNASRGAGNWIGGILFAFGIIGTYYLANNH